MSAVLDIVPARTALPTLVAAAGGKARERFLEFFAAQIRNRHTRRAYGQATREFLAWCERAGVASIADVKPSHVAATIEQLARLSQLGWRTARKGGGIKAGRSEVSTTWRVAGIEPADRERQFAAAAAAAE